MTPNDTPAAASVARGGSRAEISLHFFASPVRPVANGYVTVPLHPKQPPIFDMNTPTEHIPRIILATLPQHGQGGCANSRTSI